MTKPQLDEAETDDFRHGINARVALFSAVRNDEDDTLK
jgi:hypothetical protein